MKMKNKTNIILILLASLCLWGQCSAAVLELTVEGTYDHGRNFELWGQDLDFVLKVQYDDTWIDLDLDPLHGLYEGSAVVTLAFGPWYFEHDETQIQVWAGKDGFWGVTFGSDGDFDQETNGIVLRVLDYLGYASFIHSTPLAIDDRLMWVEQLAGDPENESSSYTFIRTIRLSDGVLMEAQKTDGGLNYSVTEVPEPSYALFAFLCSALTFNLRPKNR